MHKTFKFWSTTSDDTSMKPCLSSGSTLRWAVLSLALLLGGCDLLGVLGIETADQVAAQREADGKAIGSGCRHAERSIEECYQNNPRASKAAVFAGWREMDEYMREHKVAGMPPKPPTVIDETAEGAPVSTRPGASSSNGASPQRVTAGTSAPNSQVRPTGTGVAPATPNVRPVLPAPSSPSATPPGSANPRPASGGAAGGPAPRPAGANGAPANASRNG